MAHPDKTDWKFAGFKVQAFFRAACHLTSSLLIGASCFIITSMLLPQAGSNGLVSVQHPILSDKKKSLARDFHILKGEPDEIGEIGEIGEIIVESFPVSEQLESQVEFWKDIFTVYGTNQVVIHDRWYIDVIFEVVERKGKKSGLEKVRNAIKKNRLILESMAAKWNTPLDMNQDELAFYKLYMNVDENSRFLKKDAHLRVHAQQGQAESIKKGIIYSGFYMDSIVKTFSEYDLPVELTCLPLIESAFNPYSVSSVRAVGLWQIMPATGRQFGLNIGFPIDERRDTASSTIAAAKLLSHNYEVLQSWPLAITAYNFGLGGMAKAMRAVESDLLGDVIQCYDSPRFSYASRNFYAEFIAAVHTYKNRDKYFDNIQIGEHRNFTRFKIPEYVAFDTLEKYCGLKISDIKILNPALHKSVFHPKKFIPKNYVLNIPQEYKNIFASKYESIPKSERFVYLSSREKHRIRKKETLSGIARRYNTTVKELRRLNSLSNPRRIRAGQVLKIPGKYVSLADQLKAKQAG
ncbi:transglycosylase SLT domain-containing protein [Desulfobacterales bacterium HSG16]|nr:transglycosylase SLT domain-containing protein [Desulfobacterales bacterium HSG16]